MRRKRVIISVCLTALLAAAFGVAAPVYADEPASPPASGFAFISTGASGDAVTVSRGQDIPTFFRCGYQWEYEVLAHIWVTPAAFPGSVRPALATAVIPPGKHTLTFVEYCPPDNIYRVEFATPP